MKKQTRYTFLEWVFDGVGLAKFLLYFFLFLLIISGGVLTFIWWLTKE